MNPINATGYGARSYGGDTDIDDDAFRFEAELIGERTVHGDPP